MFCLLHWWFVVCFGGFCLDWLVELCYDLLVDFGLICLAVCLDVW